MGMLDGIEVFTAAVECGSFTAAARKLGVTASAVSRRIASLENELGVPLLTRTTRVLRLTKDGVAFHQRCVRILEDLREARRDVTRAGKKPAGVLRVDAPSSLGRHRLIQHIPEFLERYPEIDLELTLRDQFVDPVAEGIDLLVRIAPLADSSLMVRMLGESRIVVCGSPSYLERRGAPRSLKELARHNCLGYLREGRPDPWRFVGAAGVQAVDIRGRFHTNEVDAMLAAALAGQGLIAVFDFLVAGALAKGDLIEVLSDHPTLIRPIHALYPKHRHLVPKVTVFLDFLVKRVFAPTAGGRSRRR
jgi:DNA-binding transcriptional LysR family regulator